MPNSIATASKYIPVLDEVYQRASVTAVLDGAPDLAREGANAGELIIPKLSMQGLADYTDKYADGDVSMVNETVTCNFNRGRMFSVDNVQNKDTADLAFGRLAGEFIRTKVAPELDAFRFASYCGTPGVKVVSGALADGAAVVAALRGALDAMDNAEVPPQERYLFILPSYLAMVSDMPNTNSRAVLDEFASITKVPPTRFYSAIDSMDGVSADEKIGGYKKAAAGKQILFSVIHKPAVIQFEKHAEPKIVTPQANQNADSWKFGYHNVSIADVYENKVSGLYFHTEA